MNIDIDNLKTVPADLYKLNNVLDNDVFRKTVYEKLVTKVNVIDTSTFLLKSQFNTDKSGLEKKINNTDKKIPDDS